MKKIVFVALMSVIGLSVFARGKQPVAFQKMPEVLQTEILNHFEQDQVQLITSEKTMPRHHRFVFHMADGTRLEYMSVGRKKFKVYFRNIANKDGIQTAYVPENVMTYITETFPNATVTSYKLDLMKQDIVLNDNMDLVFSKKGKFIRID